MKISQLQTTVELVKRNNTTPMLARVASEEPARKRVTMIPESAGATPYGIFLLADDYLSAAKLAFRDPRIGTGPVRLMTYHAAELFLKTYMRSAGETVDALRALGHDLEKMVIRAKSLGLKLPAQILAQSRKLSANNDYVRARYVVVREPTDISDQSVLRYCQTIRSSVIEALNMDEQGVPQGEHWLGALPSDYPIQAPTEAP
ncbi:HEPN domain-containing protein [Mesorhizobium sp. ES1-6]|uniref:HEPN domain-containing protein n=1 Tax=Mesorhizobium sp. ES1-6 TaxID=2876626 RepID=UPI001CC97F74|nr:HEPN domain-containing protein [Mesorhizobium sp. ES1-6]MBZ9805759.1 HEPN domain-containing protein [Mesorhizobium sp. ES1-6]